VSRLDLLERGWPAAPSLAGLPGGAASYAIAAAADAATLVVVPSPEDADKMAREIAFHAPGLPTMVLPPDDVRAYEGLSPHPDLVLQRIAALTLLQGKVPAVVLASARAVCHRVLSSAALIGLTETLRVGDRITPSVWVEGLIQRGYRSTHKVDEPGLVSARGAVVDIWPTGAEQPARIELFDEDVEDIRTLDPVSQRSTSSLAELRIPPAREAVPTASALSRATAHTAEVVDTLGAGHTARRSALEELRGGLWFPGAEDLLPALYDLVCPSTYAERLVVVEPDEVQRLGQHFSELAIGRWELRSEENRVPVRPQDRYTPPGRLAEVLAGATCIVPLASDESVDFGAQDNRSMQVGKGDLAPVAGQLQDWAEAGLRVVLVVSSSAESERLMALLVPHGIVPQAMDTGQLPTLGEIGMWTGDLPRGFHCESSQLALVTMGELFGEKRPPRRVARALKDAALGSVVELKVGGLVVHIRHGVGRFERLKRIELDGLVQEYAEVHYRGDDKLYLPVTRLDELYRYRAVGNAKPRLDRLGGETWDKKKSKVRDRILAMAHTLLAQHAERAVRPGHAYEGLPPLYHQFVQTFPFEETPDQQAAIDEVLHDLAQPTPMDRLVVGDVGFGKTEVAMRAAMRVVLGGRQVAILCPTTVLSFQHLETFKKRFSGLPVRVALLSAFRSAAERGVVLDAAAAGEVDILIGTTSILGRQLRFAQLGLVIVDEEHRFGVKQKSKLKQLLAGGGGDPVDYLAMSATPIPRTLHMALSGLRKVSLMATPPEGRRSVQTRVTAFDPGTIRDDILAELKRGGQVFFVHNRVQSIHSMARFIEKLVPEAKVVVGHGQMDKRQLERTLVDFIQRKTTVLVCTTIIESGVDIPSVNTMIVNRADRLGVAQLYQLRGRVGRSHVRARCTFLMPKNQTLNKAAMLRLRALQEHTELGSGFALATRDMEIRGSGTLLGDAQHGHIQAVGLDTYVELLEEAIASAKGELAATRLDPEIEVPVPCLLPESYMPELDDRIAAYRRLSAARSTAEVRALIGAWEETWGEPPPEVLNLGWSAETKVRCRDLGIQQIRWMQVRVSLDFAVHTQVDPDGLVALVGQQSERFSLSVVPRTEPPVSRLMVRFSPEEGRWPFRFIHWLLGRLDPEPVD
jgi:transcription-repair coupling factor (superfamily II helicase)